MFKKLPEFLRYFLRDTIIGSVVSILALTVVGDAQSLGHAVLVAVGIASVQGARANLQRFEQFINDLFGTQSFDAAIKEDH